MFIYLIVSNLAPLFLIVPLLFLSCSFLSFPNLFFEDWVTHVAILTAYAGL